MQRRPRRSAAARAAAAAAAAAAAGLLHLLLESVPAGLAPAAGAAGRCTGHAGWNSELEGSTTAWVPQPTAPHSMALTG